MAYLVLASPTVLLIFVRVLCGLLPDLIVSQFMRPVDMIDYGHHLWNLQDHFFAAFVMCIQVCGIAMVLFLTSLVTPRIRRWLNARAPLWGLVLLIDWLVLGFFFVTPIIRG